ncbi:MAG: tRNA (cytidine(34)-2'-O)-methyltransferase [Bacteriovorax sp.]|nr:tRNA (cytidine(34)-2'-O)-methyltransferase [Bacteriovorax sp.]
MSKFKIVLVAPEIPGNTGSIGRTCVALDLELILIKPLAFDISEKAVRRAGLDYWKHVSLKIYENFEDFLEKEKPAKEHLFFFSKTAQKNLFEAQFKKDSYLIFGSETKGLDPTILAHYSNELVSLPMYSEHIRSLNLSNAATAAAYEALRQIDFNNIS